MTNHKLIVLLLSLSIICPVVKAQVSASHMRMQQQALYQTDMMRRFRQQGSTDMGNAKKNQGKYKFYIVALNGDTIDSKKKLKVLFTKPIDKLTYGKKSKQITYTPDQTKEIFVKDKSKTIRGIPHEDNWVFNTISTQNVKFYAPFPESDIAYITYYQPEGDSIKVLNKDAMKMLVAGNAKAQKQLEKGKTGKALKIFIDSEHKKEKNLKKEED